MSVGVRDVEPGMSSVYFVVLLKDDTEDGLDVLVCCGETNLTLMSSVRTQKIIIRRQSTTPDDWMFTDKIRSDVQPDVQNFLLLGLLYR